MTSCVLVAPGTIADEEELKAKGTCPLREKSQLPPEACRTRRAEKG
jgi:hypothetical protein